MKKTILGVLAVLVTWSQVPTSSQGGVPPTVATDITNAQVLAVLKLGHLDEQLKIVDTGKYNVAVGILHRGAVDAGQAAARGVSFYSHNQVTEVYYIISGAGTLVTAGTAADARPTNLRVLAGPSMTGLMRGGQSRQVTAGDVIIIPAGVPHGFSAIDDHVDYLSVRVDADHVLPAGYVHEAIKGATSAGGIR